MTRPSLRIVLIFSALLLAAPCLAQTSPRIKKLQQQSSALQKQINDSEKLLRTTKKDVKSQLNNLAVINSQITEQKRLVDGYTSEVSALQGNIVQLQNELRALTADLDACKRKYRRVLLYMNRNRLLQNRLAFILQARSFRQMYRRMRLASAYTKFLRAQAAVIAEKSARVKAKADELHAAKADKDVLLADARSQHQVLEGQQKQKQTIVNDLSKKQKELQKSINQQKKKQQQINAQVDRLIKKEIAAAEARRKKQEAERKAAEKRRQEEKRRKQEAEAKGKKGNKSSKSSKSSTSTSKPTKTAKPRYEEADETDRTISSSFRANKGRLPIPITGSYAITSTYGQYNVEGLSGVTLDSKGINLTGHAGAQARCVFNGEVSAVANIGGQYIVIVRHGDFYSVYSNLASVSVRNGQQVSTRQTLGTVASDASGNRTLHFQLRQRAGSSANHINPLPWLAR